MLSAIHESITAGLKTRGKDLKKTKESLFTSASIAASSMPASMQKILEDLWQKARRKKGKISLNF